MVILTIISCNNALYLHVQLVIIKKRKNSICQMSIHVHAMGTDVYIEGTGFLSILPIVLPTRESGIHRDKYVSAAIFKEAVYSDDP